MIDLDELEKLAANATPGPWDAVLEKDPRGQPSIFYRAIIGLLSDGDRSIAVTQSEGLSPNYVKGAHEGNAKFIAACREAVPELIREVRYLGRCLDLRNEALAETAASLREALAENARLRAVAEAARKYSEPWRVVTADGAALLDALAALEGT